MTCLTRVAVVPCTQSQFYFVAATFARNTEKISTLIIVGCRLDTAQLELSSQLAVGSSSAGRASIGTPVAVSCQLNYCLPHVWLLQGSSLTLSFNCTFRHGLLTHSPLFVDTILFNFQLVICKHHGTPVAQMC